MTKYTTINGVEFETHKSKYARTYRIMHNPKRLEDCYDKPSKYKEEIYYDWLDWFSQTENIYSFGVTSYSTFYFTIGAVLFDLETGVDIGYIQITKDHNKLYLFTD